jgi:protein toll
VEVNILLQSEFHSQISNSIDQSRRTIVFLSASFIESDWCKHEFRAAQVEASHEQRNRIIVITYGNIEDTEKMDKELRTYLRLHLYIKFEDPRFWDKLRYAMPHQRREVDSHSFIRGRRGGYLQLPGK